MFRFLCFNNDQREAPQLLHRNSPALFFEPQYLQIIIPSSVSLSRDFPSLAFREILDRIDTNTPITATTTAKRETAIMKTKETILVTDNPRLAPHGGYVSSNGV
jgi:hypothetical protein